VSGERDRLERDFNRIQAEYEQARPRVGAAGDPASVRFALAETRGAVRAGVDAPGGRDPAQRREREPFTWPRRRPSGADSPEAWNAVLDRTEARAQWCAERAHADRG